MVKNIIIKVMLIQSTSLVVGNQNLLRTHLKVVKRITTKIQIMHQQRHFKGCPKKNVTAQNFEILFSKEPCVLGGCPFHRLVYS